MSTKKNKDSHIDTSSISSSTYRINTDIHNISKMSSYFPI